MVRCIPCLAEDFKIAINEKFKTVEVAALLSGIPNCPDGQLVNFCKKTSKGSTGGGGQKRAPSAYQTFIGSCLRDKHLKGFDPEAMKDCAVKWKGSPNNPKRSE